MLILKPFFKYENNSLYVSLFHEVLKYENEIIELDIIRVFGEKLKIEKIVDSTILIKGKITKIEII